MAQSDLVLQQPAPYFCAETEAEFQAAIQAASAKYTVAFQKLKKVYNSIDSGEWVSPEAFWVDEDRQVANLQLENMIVISVNLQGVVSFSQVNPFSGLGFRCGDYQTALLLDEVNQEVWADLG